MALRIWDKMTGWHGGKVTGLSRVGDRVKWSNVTRLSVYWKGVKWSNCVMIVLGTVTRFTGVMSQD